MKYKMKEDNRLLLLVIIMVIIMIWYNTNYPVNMWNPWKLK